MTAGKYFSTINHISTQMCLFFLLLIIFNGFTKEMPGEIDALALPVGLPRKFSGYVYIVA